MPKQSSEEKKHRIVNYIKRSVYYKSLQTRAPLSFFVALSTILMVGCSDKENNPFSNNQEAKADNTAQESPPQDNKSGTTGPSPLSIKDDSIEEPLPSKGAKVRRTPIEEKRIAKKGASNISINLDGDRVNRLNQRRDPSLIDQYPELFGPYGDFRPLLTMDTRGPGIIKIRSWSLGEIEIPLDDKLETLEIYPEYDINELFNKKALEEDKIDIIFIDGRKETLVEQIDIKWSQQGEVYLPDSNLSDLIPIIEEGIGEVKPNFKTVNSWLRAAAAGLEKLKIKEEKIKDTAIWQPIRDSKEIRHDKKANALDLTVWLARKGAENGFRTYVIALPRHVMLGVSEIDGSASAKEGMDNMIYVETTYLLEEHYDRPGAFEQEGDPLGDRVSKSIEMGTKRVNEQFLSGPDKMFALDIKEWENYYRDQPK